MARVITITSGKGGVGKTSISLNLCLELAAAGYKVALFDADLGLANINVLTGIHPEKTLSSVIDGQASLDEILLKNYQGIDIIPGSSGVEKLADLDEKGARRLIRSFVGLDNYDFLIFDTSAGISPQVISFCMASTDILLVVTPEPTSLTDAYAMLKLLSKKRYSSTVKIVINRVKNKKEAETAYFHLKETVKQFLAIDISPLGMVVKDKHVGMAVISQTPFSMVFPDAPATKCIKQISQKIAAGPGGKNSRPIEEFWEKCLGFLSGETISAKIEAMEENIARLLNEVKALRETLSAEENRQEQRNETPPEPSPKVQILLDFKAWLKQRTG
ncbi:MAG: P-loop NTPase [Desulfobacteraceae bacterium]